MPPSIDIFPTPNTVATVPLVSGTVLNQSRPITMPKA